MNLNFTEYSHMHITVLIKSTAILSNRNYLRREARRKTLNKIQNQSQNVRRKKLQSFFFYLLKNMEIY